MEEIAKYVANQLSLVVEILGIIIIGIGLVQFLIGYVPRIFARNQDLTNTQLRVKFGSILTLSLELLLAADILRTAVAPSWDAIGKLAAIAAIRTGLNFFLEKELTQIEGGADNRSKFAEQRVAKRSR